MTNSIRSIAFVKFPKAGLGNMLLTWARAYVFSKLNHIELITSSWATIHAGAWLRMENKKRFYAGYFRKVPILKKTNAYFKYLFFKKIYEPPVTQVKDPGYKCIYIFNKIFTDYDFFKDLRPYKAIIRQGIVDMLRPGLKRVYHNSKPPVIGIHIRRGDFKIGSTITPESFFIDVIQSLRKEKQEVLPVTVFTDAAKSELKELLKLDSIFFPPAQPDILDILLLAKSEIIVLSIGSTFSYWAAFLSEGLVIRHESEWHVPFKQNEDQNVEWIWSNQKN